jgi:hypothetical protein
MNHFCVAELDGTAAHLGIRSGHISLDQLSVATTQHNGPDKQWLQSQAKLFTDANPEYNVMAGWKAPSVTATYFHVDLYNLHEIHGVITQGSGSSDDYVTSLSIRLSTDTFSWTTLKKENSNDRKVRCSPNFMMNIIFKWRLHNIQLMNLFRSI